MAVNGQREREMGWFKYIADRWGFGTALLLLVGWWFDYRVGEPLVRSHVEYLTNQQVVSKELVTTLRQQADATAETVKIRTRQTAILEELQKASTRSDLAHDRQNGLLDTIEKQLAVPKGSGG
ncbi:MAG: hypothetical protein PHU85_07220 [Phycisphaerae bacterium]|nr:hypothetical protein [Phycisphaerae bacterium]